MMMMMTMIMTVDVDDHLGEMKERIFLCERVLSDLFFSLVSGCDFNIN